MPPRIEITTLPPAGLRLPAQLQGLERLAFNHYWMWHPRVRVLFRRIDVAAWLRYRNPVPLLQVQRDWSEVLDDVDLMAEYRTLLDAFDRYMDNGAGHWFEREHGADLDGPVAYFCAEYGLNEALGIYSGGLGVLAGDHLKAASDMAIPFIGVGLFYRHGYFRQTIDADGHQEHAYPDYDPQRLPLRRVADDDGGPLRIGVEMPGRTVYCAVWLAQVGRVPLLLLDTDIPDNDETDRPITHILYVRGREMRLHQEMVLGVGGVRALRALGIEPRAWHLNEGHSAFMLVERTRELTVDGTPLDEALATRQAQRRLHHPHAGLGRQRALRHRACSPPGRAAGRGQQPRPRAHHRARPWRRQRPRPVRHDRLLAARDERRQRGQPAPRRRRPTAPGRASSQTPILGITNGVHPPRGWAARLARCTSQLGADVDDLDQQTNPFWETRRHSCPTSSCGRRIGARSWSWPTSARRKLQQQFARHGEAPSLLEELAEALDPEVLTIGFARRFATYKRASLIFSDEERLARILLDDERPVQIIFAGKAHPADRPGQRVIQDIFTRSRSPKFAKRVFVLEDYDIRVGRYLVQGVDVWLNNPRRPLEASGTSGMKAAMNGVINFSVLDGWWDEGYNGKNGWAIGGRESVADEGAQDWADAQDLYRLLENEIIPGLLRARQGRPAAALAADDEGVDGQRDLAVLDQPHARGVRRAALPAGRRRQRRRSRRQAATAGRSRSRG